MSSMAISSRVKAPKESCTIYLWPIAKPAPCQRLGCVISYYESKEAGGKYSSLPTEISYEAWIRE
jgi:hypothetical protein